MRAVRDGDVEQLGVLFERYHARVHALCSRLTRRADIADDLAQEVFLRVLRYPDGFREESSLATWLYRIAYNVCHDHWRRDRRADEVERTLSVGPISPQGVHAMDERHVRLDEAMARLTPEQRAILVLSRYHDLGYDNIARVLDCTPAAARVRAHRALHELRETYRELEQRTDHLRASPRIDRR